MTAEPEGCAAAPPERSFLERSAVGWHVAFLTLPPLTDVLAALSGLRGGGLLAYVLLTAALLGWYGLVGRPALTGARAGWAVPYTAGAVLLFAGLVLLNPAGFLVLFVLFPQVFAMLPLRSAIAAAAALTVVTVLANLVGTDWSAGDVARAGAAGLVNLLVATLLGLWITGIVHESRRRAELLTELRRTQADLAAAHHEAGVLAERERLSAEIHDTLAQGFTSVLVLAQAADAALTEDSGTGVATARARLHSLEQTARENLAETRALVAALAPAVLEGASLAEAVRRLAARATEHAGTAVEVTVEGEPRPLSPSAEVVLLRAAQEALTNVRRHAGARRVTVRLTYDDAGAHLDVTDDGRGFTPGEGPPEGTFGLRGMHGRATQVGGVVSVRSEPGAGTTVAVSVP